MPDREKVIKGLEQCIKVPYICDPDCPYYNTSLCREELKKDALALLKEQEKQKFFVDESGKITPLPVVVRCKDCKYWHETIYDTPKWMPCMSVQTSGNWFCADGERRDSP